MKLAFLLMMAASDPASWISERGGAIERDARGNVIAVDLSGSWVTDTDLEQLASLPRLAKLNLGHTRISDQGMRRLKRLENITSLDLTYAELVTDEGLTALRGWKHLERLKLRGTKITDAGVAHLAGLTTLAALDVGLGRGHR